MRVEKVSHTFSPFVNIVISATAEEVEGNTALDWHNEVQVVKGHTTCDLLDEAARRLNESDSGVDWSRAAQLRDLAAEIRGEEAVTAQFKAAQRQKGGTE